MSALLEGADGGNDREQHIAMPSLSKDEGMDNSDAHGSLVMAVTLALVTVTAYAFNSQVFIWIGTSEFTSPLFTLWMCHVGLLVLLPFYATCGDPSALVEEVCCSRGMNRIQLMWGAVLTSLFLMGNMYLWLLSSMSIPMQVLASIFQSSIATVYVFSVLFLGEHLSTWKLIGALLAILGVCISSIFKAGDWHCDEEFVGICTGVFFAIGAMLGQSMYVVWFKRTFGDPSPRFMLFFFVLVGLANVFVVLPLLAVGAALGFQDAQIYISIEGTVQACLICVAVMLASFVNLGSLTVIALRTPVFMASFQMLAIPLSVFFDFLFHGIRPLKESFLGFGLIVVAFLALTGFIGPREKERTSSFIKCCKACNPRLDGAV